MDIPSTEGDEVPACAPGRYVLAAPPKPVNEMSDAERKAWVDLLFDAIARQHPEEHPYPDKSYPVPGTKDGPRVA